MVDITVAGAYVDVTYTPSATTAAQKLVIAVETGKGSVVSSSVRRKNIYETVATVARSPLSLSL